MNKRGWLSCWGCLLLVSACGVDESSLVIDASEEALASIGFECGDGWGWDYGPLMDEALFAYAEEDCFDDPWGGGGDPWGGGGFGDPFGDEGGPCRWLPATTKTSWRQSTSTKESEAIKYARADAYAQAESDCLRSSNVSNGNWCDAYVQTISVVDNGCALTDVDYPDEGPKIEHFTCGATATAQCAFR